MRQRTVPAVAVALVASAALAACGGSSGNAPTDNGVAAKSPVQIVAAANSAITGLKSVHVVGSIVSSGQPIGLNLDLVSGMGGRGNMTIDGLSVQLIDVGKFVYINGSKAFWLRFGNAAAAALLQGKWLKASTTSGSFASLAALLDLRHLLSAMLAGHGTLAKGPTTTVEGQKVVGITDTSHGGTLYVATVGKPYPVELLKTGTGGGHVLFGRFNESVALVAPKTAVDLSALGSSG